MLTKDQIIAAATLEARVAPESPWLNSAPDRTQETVRLQMKLCMHSESRDRAFQPLSADGKAPEGWEIVA